MSHAISPDKSDGGIACPVMALDDGKLEYILSAVMDPFAVLVPLDEGFSCSCHHTSWDYVDDTHMVRARSV